ncbi:TetR/AcrR family transcriptional regulator [Agrobacterium sp. Azo12]|jgi:AcrR family transcriptional regulator|uniref:TetR/AcrR family transcriptional regulator n=1 Tax=Agrobacterium sp. Azo12 TaxID=3031129 RepID=UPI0023D7BE7A|nr:TetR/AcrR family transcriptional regulator [Agrobacterium sp. Azo12]MDO5897379.1 TetR/AcrR family transcriptional regulator [Agrobacterium sp. Azo12]
MRSPKRETRKNDPDKTKEDILAAATEEFAALGLAGGRVDAIAERTKTSKRMIYYYFGGKTGLYLAVLEKAYIQARTFERELNLEALSPVEALKKLIEHTFDHDEANPDFVRLVMNENIHQAMHLKQSKAIGDAGPPVLKTLEDIITRGRKTGVFRRDIEPLDLHMLISSQCFFRVTNKHTFGTLFQCDLSVPDIYQRHRQMVVDSVLAYVTTDCSGSQWAAP